MSEATVYEYRATPVGSSGLDFSVSPGNEQSTGSAVVANLSQGDQFVFDGKIFTYDGGADLGPNEVGFFATGKNGAVHFFSTTPLPGTNPETLTLNNGQSYTICFMAGDPRCDTWTGLSASEELTGLLATSC